MVISYLGHPYLFNCRQETRRRHLLELPALSVVISAKELDISGDFLLADNTVKWHFECHCTMRVLAL